MQQSKYVCREFNGVENRLKLRESVFTLFSFLLTDAATGFVATRSSPSCLFFPEALSA
jgi:hypothetical protein